MCQMIHQNILVLQYNQMALEQIQVELCATDHFVRHVHFLIYKSRQSAVSMYIWSAENSLSTYIRYMLIFYCTP